MGIHDDEFPDDHSHDPQDLGDDRHGVFVTDDEGRHYWLEHKVTDEGVIIDLHDRYGEECLATFARTWDELAEHVLTGDPARALVERIARLQTDGEADGGLANDDVWVTLHDLIDHARGITGITGTTSLPCSDTDPEHVHDEDHCCECGGQHCCGSCPTFVQVVPHG